tara:strand:+ start:29281 stop:29838 length:558 start_codon:yes stop_codon:yes gene_type:complete
MSVVASCLALALALALSAGACGRIGYDAGPDTDATPNAATIDARSTNGGDGGSVSCAENSSGNCADMTIGLGTGSTQVFDVLQSYPTPLIPTCGAGPVSEVRTTIRAPSVPSTVTFEVAADTDIFLTILSDDCDGAVLQCMHIPANSNGSIQISTQPSERFLVSAASNDSCGGVGLTIAGTADGS